MHYDNNCSESSVFSNFFPNSNLNFQNFMKRPGKRPMQAIDYNEQSLLSPDVFNQEMFQNREIYSWLTKTNQ